jgi:hypothetical protein
MKIEIVDASYHRNGICGEPFTVAIFNCDNVADSKMLGIFFDKIGYVAILNINLLSDGVITNDRNAWRGDVFENDLRNKANSFLDDKYTRIIGSIGDQQNGQR